MNAKVHHHSTPDLVQSTIEKMRYRLLDITRRNPLIATKFSNNSNSYIRVVDELPDVLIYNLSHEKQMRIIPLPSFEEDPRDEQTSEFQQQLTNAMLTDEVYLQAIKNLDPHREDSLDRRRALERELRDRIRALLNMPPRQKTKQTSLVQHAKNNNINPSHELPLPTDHKGAPKHNDNDIQTLLLPDELEKKLTSIISKNRSWMQETGLNTLHGAFGFLEWAEHNEGQTSLAPLVLIKVVIEKKKTRSGSEFKISGSGEDAETNTVLIEKLKHDFDIDLPTYQGGSIEDYFDELKLITNKIPKWNVRRQIAFGIFPSARMAMFYDLDTSQYSHEPTGIVSQLLGGYSSNDPTPFADEYDVDQPAIESKVPCLVVPADSSQFSTIVDVAKGMNIAVEGPPGTGKSQTIVNTIAAALAAGKKVLFVAEKGAALDVVKSRLEAAGLGEFLLPLLADRSSREQVISSIRQRLEMSSPLAPKAYDSKIQKFRQVRSELASYINVMTTTFANTGFTVHQIIGKCIARTFATEAISKALFKKEIANLENYNSTKVDQIITSAKAVERNWIAARKVEAYWQNNKLTNFNKFIAEELLEIAKLSYESFKSSADAHQELSQIGFDTSGDPEQLNSILTLLKELKNKQQDIDILRLIKLSQDDNLSHVKHFFTSCSQYQALDHKLSRYFLQSNYKKLASDLIEVHQICIRNNINTLDSRILEQRLHSLHLKLKAFEDAQKQMLNFITLFPTAMTLDADVLKKARVIASEASQETLILSQTLNLDPLGCLMARKALELGRVLQKQMKDLEETIFVASEISIESFKEHLATLRSSGIFRFFSAKYQAAKKAYLSISKRKRFNRSHAINEIQQLIDWKNEKSRFLSDPQITSVLGSHFKGIHTDFDSIERLVNFNQDLENNFPGSSNPAIKELLRSGNLEIISAIPSIEHYVWKGDFIRIEEDIKTIIREITSLTEDVQQLKELLTDVKFKDEISIDSLPKLAEDITTNLSLKKELENNSLAQDILSDLYQGADTPSDLLTEEIGLSEEILKFHSNRKSILKVLESNNVDKAVLLFDTAIKSEESGLESLRLLAEKTGISLEQFTENKSRQEIASFLNSASQDFRGLNIHANYAIARHDLFLEGFDWVVIELENNKVPLDNLSHVIEGVIFTQMTKLVYSKFEKELSKFTGTKLNEARKQIADLDTEILNLSRQMLRAKLVQTANPPMGISEGYKSQWTEMSLIYNEVSKKRYIPVRDLTHRAGQALLEIKPCWMLSPLAVAQYINKDKIKFDLCIIDEASQMPPEDAIGALMRCRQAMIVGDTNQLPPTNFFWKMNTDEDDDEEELIISESILELANAVFRPVRRLRWHYRSRHSSLISFSNHMIYNNDLIVFPSPSEERSDMGVSLVQVKGRYRSGTNLDEAKVMVKAALEFMRNTPERSLGIVTVNQKQKSLIESEMEFELAQDRIAQDYVEKWKTEKDGLEPFFIKNLENVQGDERDVIFIGTVYGPEKVGGPVMQRFGPISGVAGRRRLNVLFSRARMQIVTFTSMTAADIKVDEAKNKNTGTYMLKRWLEFANTGILQAGEQTNREPDSPFEEFVIEQIRSMGCTAVPQVGVSGFFIDIGVKHPDWPYGYILGVECDGATYHSSKSARDRDKLRQELLEGLGWTLYRIWSTDWFNNPYDEISKLKSAIEEQLKALKEKRVQSSNFDPKALEKSQSKISKQSTSKIVNSKQAPSINIPEKFKSNNSLVVELGDKVLIKNLLANEPVKEYVLTDGPSNPHAGILNEKTPLGKALLGYEEGEEIEYLVDKSLNKFRIEKVIKAFGTDNKNLNIKKAQ